MDSGVQIIAGSNFAHLIGISIQFHPLSEGTFSPPPLFFSRYHNLRRVFFTFSCFSLLLLCFCIPASQSSHVFDQANSETSGANQKDILGVSRSASDRMWSLKPTSPKLLGRCATSKMGESRLTIWSISQTQSILSYASIFFIFLSLVTVFCTLLFLFRFADLQPPQWLRFPRPPAFHPSS
jgi:hypothetical protein